jgi:(2Fe-2S) ferredoxin
VFNIKHHLFLCINQRPAGHPKGCCASKGSRTLLEKFKEEFERRQLHGSAMVNGATCLDTCAAGPCMVVYPEGIWYGPVAETDVTEIIEQHLVGGQPVKRLIMQPPAQP